MRKESYRLGTSESGLVYRASSPGALAILVSRPYVLEPFCNPSSCVNTFIWMLILIWSESYIHAERALPSNSNMPIYAEYTNKSNRYMRTGNTWPVHSLRRGKISNQIKSSTCEAERNFFENPPSIPHVYPRISQSRTRPCSLATANCSELGEIATDEIRPRGVLDVGQFL
jgi:hypothetical protein